MVLTATLHCDIVVIMNDIFSCKRTHQLRKGVTPIIFNSALVVMGFCQVTAIYSLLRLWDGENGFPLSRE